MKTKEKQYVRMLSVELKKLDLHLDMELAHKFERSKGNEIQFISLIGDGKDLLQDFWQNAFEAGAKQEREKIENFISILTTDRNNHNRLCYCPFIAPKCSVAKHLKESLLQNKLVEEKTELK